MARNKSTEIELTAYDDLFQTDESREEAKLSKIRDIPISEIDEFPDHPFKVLIDEDMEQLVESIKRNGVMTPATVRLKEDGRYELISGHRRRKACELAGLETLKCEVKDLSRDEAIIIMVESNLQRSTILPSEKAFAYKMRLEAMKRQAGRPTKDNYSPMGNNLEFATSSDELAEKVGESKNQIFRFIRLTELVPEILQMVDDRQIAFRPAVEISYLSEEQQYTLLEAMEYSDATPSLAQAIKMKKFMQDGKLTNEVKITAGGVIGKVSENEIKSPVDGTVISATNSSEIIPNNYPVATVRYTGFALNVEAENFLKTLPENTTLKAKFQVINGVGPTDILAVVTPATEYAEGSSTNTLFPQSNVLQCLIDKDTDVKIGQNATVVITAGTKENILLLPLSVIAGRQGKGMVTVIKDGEQIQTEVTLGATDGAYIEILSGVEEGDVVSSVPPNLDPRSNS